MAFEDKIRDCCALLNRAVWQKKQQLEPIALIKVAIAIPIAIPIPNPIPNPIRRANPIPNQIRIAIRISNQERKEL